MAFITFNYNKNLNYAIAYWALEIIIRTFMYIKWDFFFFFLKDSINEYIYLILLVISDLLAGFLVLYTQCSLKQKKSVLDTPDDIIKKRSTIKKIEYISDEERTLQYSKNFIYKMILICILDYINRAAFFIFYQTNKDANHENISHKAQKDIIIHLDILMRYAFAILILKTKVFKHHKLSLILITIGFIILIPMDILQIQFSEKIKDKLSYIYIGVFAYRGILFPFEDTIVKQIFSKEYILPEYIMFLRGIGELILLIIVTPILYFCLWSNESFDFVHNKTQMAFNIIIYIVSSFIKAILLLTILSITNYISIKIANYYF